MAAGNGIVDEIIRDSLENIAKGTATDTDKMIVVLCTLSERQRKDMELMKPAPFRLFGRTWSSTELAFLIGGLFVIDAGVAAGLTSILS